MWTGQHPFKIRLPHDPNSPSLLYKLFTIELSFTLCFSARAPKAYGGVCVLCVCVCVVCVCVCVCISPQVGS